MKPALKITLTALMAAIAFSTMAAETADLAVKGTIRPSACNIAISSNGVVDFGTISATTLNADALTQLPDVTETMTVTCDAPTRFAVTTADNRAGTVASSAKEPGYATSVHHGLGAINGTNIGSWQLYFEPSVTADGNTAQTIYQQFGTSEGTWTQVAATGPTAGRSQPGIRYFAWSAQGQLTPTAYTTLVQPLIIRVRIASKASLPSITNGIPLDGSATISLTYL